MSMVNSDKPKVPERPTINTSVASSAQEAPPIAPGSGKRIHDIDEPIPDPSELLSYRLDNWVHCINILYDYVDTYTTLTKKSIQSYEKIKKSISTLPRFTRYEGNGGGSLSRSNSAYVKGDEPEGGRISIPKSGSINRNFNATSRSSTMGSSEIVLGALNSPVFKGSKEHELEEALPSYSDPSNQPEMTAQQRARSNDEFAPHNRGIDGLFEMLRLKNDMNLTSLYSLDKQIKEQILPVFKELISEVSTYRKKFNNTVDKNHKSLNKIKKSKAKLVNELENSIRLYNDAYSNSLRSSTGQLVDDPVNYEKDPFLVKKFFFKNLNEELIKENQIVEQLINLKEEIFTLEIKIIATIKKLVILFNNFQITHFEEMINNLSIINNEFSLFDENFEMSKFLSSLELDNSDSDKNEAHRKDDLLLLLSSKLPVDNDLVAKNLKKDINYITVEDPKLFSSINHDSTIPILKDLITYQEVRKMSLKDKLNKHHLKYDYFALTKLKYLFVFGTDNEITTSTAISKAQDSIGKTQHGEKLLTSVDKEFLKGELEPSLIFYLPRCSLIEDEDTLNTSNEEVSSDIGRSKSLKSKFGSIKKKLGNNNENLKSSSEYQIKFTGIDLNHRILNKFSKNAHRRTIIMKFHTKDQYLIWQSLIREMSGDMQELAEDFDEKLEISSVGAGAATAADNLGRSASPSVESSMSNSRSGTGSFVDAADDSAVIRTPAETPVATGETSAVAGAVPGVATKHAADYDSKDIISDHLNESYQSRLNSPVSATYNIAPSENQAGNRTSGDIRRQTINLTGSDDDLSDAGIDSIYELREAIKKDKDKEKGIAQTNGLGTFVEDPSSIN